MVCIHCGSNTQVINSRLQKRSNQVWRRRQCQQCQSVFTTQETADYHAAWLVQSSKQAIEPFSRDKLFLSIHSSLQHRKTALSDASALTETVIRKLLGQTQNSTLPANTITQTTQVALNRFDPVASTHYQAFHRSS